LAIFQSSKVGRKIRTFFLIRRKERVGHFSQDFFPRLIPYMQKPGYQRLGKQRINLLSHGSSRYGISIGDFMETIPFAKRLSEILSII